METYYCDCCNLAYYAHEQYQCQSGSCECNNPLGRSFCSKECHDDVMNYG